MSPHTHWPQETQLVEVIIVLAMPFVSHSISCVLHASHSSAPSPTVSASVSFASRLHSKAPLWDGVSHTECTRSVLVWRQPAGRASVLGPSSSLHLQDSGTAVSFHFPILMMSRWAKLQRFLFWQSWCAASEAGRVFFSWPLPEQPHFSLHPPATHTQHATFPLQKHLLHSESFAAACTDFKDSVFLVRTVQQSFINSSCICAVFFLFVLKR